MSWKSELRSKVVPFIDGTEHLFQIDLRFEATNIERFRDNFRDVEYVKFPTPLRPFVTRTILVETFEVRSLGNFYACDF